MEPWQGNPRLLLHFPQMSLWWKTLLLGRCSWVLQSFSFQCYILFIVFSMGVPISRFSNKVSSFFFSLTQTLASLWRKVCVSIKTRVEPKEIPTHCCSHSEKGRMNTGWVIGTAEKRNSLGAQWPGHAGGAPEHSNSVHFYFHSQGRKIFYIAWLNRGKAMLKSIMLAKSHHHSFKITIR